uniref:Uncharacterized protein n=1 Tax=Oryza sativa subsp. japonica TaxID=39947 RepID=Q5Z5G2_ORYSJ|nr:hypothetical protein [Oryza sativa Japonica Group]BAD54607.1 hypothetical protein [Oryza sativa Japonica Group]
MMRQTLDKTALAYDRVIMIVLYVYYFVRYSKGKANVYGKMHNKSGPIYRSPIPLFVAPLDPQILPQRMHWIPNFSDDCSSRGCANVAAPPGLPSFGCDLAVPWLRCHVAVRGLTHR